MGQGLNLHHAGNETWRFLLTKTNCESVITLQSPTLDHQLNLYDKVQTSHPI